MDMVLQETMMTCNFSPTSTTSSGATIDFVIPQLVPTTPEEQALFDAGRERYQQRLTSQQKVNPSPTHAFFCQQ